jgi:tripartite-type tricarboxylate transporter receptor subunit TctC
MTSLIAPIHRRNLLRAGVLVATATRLSLVPVWAQSSADLPKGPITLVVPFAAGGATDVVSRLVAQKLADRISRPVVVENVGGGGGVIGAAKVRRAQPDGNTLLMGTVATHAIQPLSTKPAPYDPQRDFTPISLLATVPNVLLVANSVKASNVRELIALMKAQPGQFNYGSSGMGTPPHLSGELFKSMAGVDMAHVPYKGGGPAMMDLVGGQIPVLFDVLSGAASHIRAGSIRALAVTTSQRVAPFPDVPTVAEAGVPGYETYTWNAVFGPAGMPKPMVDALSRELQAVVALPDVQTKLKELSAAPVGSSPEALAILVKSELAKWGPVIQRMGGLKRD